MLLDVGASGPLAGLAVAIPVTIWGVAHSPVLPVDPGAGILLGEPLLFKAIVALFGPAIPAGQDLYLGNVAFSGWIGLLITAVNMLPVGQLDGGHVVYSLLGKKQHAIGWVFFVLMLVLGWWWQGWYVWAALIAFGTVLASLFASTWTWVAIATWTDEEWAQLASVIGVRDESLATVEARLARLDEVEKLVSDWTRTRTPLEAAERLQTVGIEAVPVQTLAETAADPQLAARSRGRVGNNDQSA